MFFDDLHHVATTYSAADIANIARIIPAGGVLGLFFSARSLLPDNFSVVLQQAYASCKNRSSLPLKMCRLVDVDA